MAKSRICSIPGCGKRYCARGYCSTHYKSIIQKGYAPPTKACGVAGCTGIAHGRRYCGKHYKRAWKYGDPLAGSTEWGAAQRFLLAAVQHVDREACLTWPYSRNQTGYGDINFRGHESSLAHRIICEMAHGAPPTPKHAAAHNCGKGHLGCVNPHHLRWATYKENEADKLQHGTFGRRGSKKKARELSA